MTNYEQRDIFFAWCKKYDLKPTNGDVLSVYVILFPPEA